MTNFKTTKNILSEHSYLTRQKFLNYSRRYYAVLLDYYINKEWLSREDHEKEIFLKDGVILLLRKDIKDLKEDHEKEIQKICEDHKKDILEYKRLIRTYI
jgi:hypothetical protein